MNIGNKTKLNNLEELDSVKLSRLDHKALLRLCASVECTVNLLEHGLKFEQGADAAKVRQGISSGRRMIEEVQRHMKERLSM